LDVPSHLPPMSTGSAIPAPAPVVPVVAMVPVVAVVPVVAMVPTVAVVPAAVVRHDRDSLSGRG